MQNELNMSKLANVSAKIESIKYGKGSIEMHTKFGGKLESKAKVKIENREDLSLAYTPGVGAVSVAIGEDGSLAKVLTLKKNTIAIVSDGSAILGLGNLGASAAIPVMEGKAAILKEFAGVDAFPICLETQDTEEIIKIIKNIAPVFGGINLEDISSPKCFEIEERLRAELDIPVMHDDQWGAATVALAALINSFKLRNQKVGVSPSFGGGQGEVGMMEKERPDSLRIVLSGTGAAGVATARLFIEYGFTNILFLDSKGLITKERGAGSGESLNKEKLELIEKSTANISRFLGGESLEEVIVGADVFVGLSKPHVLTGEMVKLMNPYSIIFALANPVPEIMPDIAKEAGAFIVATGRSDFKNQINNSLVFPGFWKGMLAAQREGTYKGVDNKAFVNMAIAIADHVKDLNTENILPDMFDKEVVNIVADSLK